jgi:mono/diheme cytochrome c family protein
MAVTPARPTALQRMFTPLAISLALLTLGAGSAATAQQIDADAALRGGRAIFHDGINRQGGDVLASAGSNVDLQGTKVACARCHGSDGTGNREGGLTAPALLWPALGQARPASPGLLPRSAYSETTLLRALRQGIDADGRPLSSAMPRFTLAPRDEADLLSYLRVLGSAADRDPGIADDEIVLGGVLPLSGPQADAGRAAEAAIRACIEQGNRSGGVFGRRIAWQALDATRLAPTEIALHLQARTLAVIAPWWNELGSNELALRLPGVPVIGPLGAAAELEGQNATLFAVSPQLSDQARVLIDAFASGDLDLGKPSTATTPKIRRLAVIPVPGPNHRAAQRASQRQALNHPGLELVAWQPMLGRSEAALKRDAVTWLVRQSVDAVLVLGSPDWMHSVATATDAPVSAPQAHREAPLLLGAFSELGRNVFDWPQSMRSRLRMSQTQPASPPPNEGALGRSPPDIREQLTHPSLQSVAYAASCLAVEGLRRTGREVSRQRLRTAIEEIRDFRTGVMGPLSYSRSNHVGSQGSAIVRITADGRSLESVRAWRTPEAW